MSQSFRRSYYIKRLHATRGDAVGHVLNLIYVSITLHDDLVQPCCLVIPLGVIPLLVLGIKIDKPHCLKLSYQNKAQEIKCKFLKATLKTDEQISEYGLIYLFICMQ